LHFAIILDKLLPRELKMKSVREELQIFVRRFGLLNASCCEECCGEQVSMPQGHILFEIRRKGNPSMQQVADELGLDITTFSRQVKGLEGKGFIVRSVSPDDRRVNLLALTPAGEGVLERIDSYMADKIERIFSIMSPFERESVIRSLELLNSALAKTDCCGVRQDTNVACCK
jgi:DNA-binding MarR family transcriptional regulator